MNSGEGENPGIENPPSLPETLSLPSHSMVALTSLLAWEQEDRSPSSTGSAAVAEQGIQGPEGHKGPSESTETPGS